MPLGHWLKAVAGGGQHPRLPEKTEAMKISDSLLMELEIQMRDAEDREREKVMEAKRNDKFTVDYSWLASAATYKYYDMPQLERIDLEELCLKIKPNETGPILTQFRESLAHEPAVSEMPRIFRSIVCQTFEKRPKEETMPEWISKSLTSLNKFRPVTRKVSPATGAQLLEDPEIQRSDTDSVHTISNSVTSSRATLTHFEITSDIVHL